MPALFNHTVFNTLDKINEWLDLLREGILSNMEMNWTSSRFESEYPEQCPIFDILIQILEYRIENDECKGYPKDLQLLAETLGCEYTEISTHRYVLGIGIGRNCEGI